MLKCKQVTELVSQKMDTSLPWYQRLEIRLHLLMCKTCHLYAKQIGFIQKAISDLEAQTQIIKLSEQSKKRIQDKLNQSKQFN